MEQCYDYPESKLGFCLGFHAALVGQESYTRAYVVHVFASCIHVFFFKPSLEDSSSNWVMPLEYSNVSVETCNLGKEVDEMRRHVMTCPMGLASCSSVVFVH